jgi:hypothetical protein
LHSSADAEILHSTTCEELPGDSVGIDVAVDDVLFNLVTKDTQLMSGSSPWRGGMEKDPLLLQLLIESTTHFGDIVLDCTASTGT